ncbi:hypothetical protein BTA30_01910 [Bacillus swezeyi]|uniref:Uncharacterized protein n=1 Tax=Bacillus swezeyi TaxID=1925020 RepID=A0A1R1S2J5_9BACI|nr:hypothetical protein BW143_15845 [Bacillus swezeyi]OMI32409.1 hypothetical protein BTA30_01910 [Bacillus swezeyi]
MKQSLVALPCCQKRQTDHPLSPDKFGEWSILTRLIKSRNAASFRFFFILAVLFNHDMCKTIHSDERPSRFLIKKLSHPESRNLLRTSVFPSKIKEKSLLKEKANG